VIAILARAGDEEATALVERWAARGAELLTPVDLSTAGWRFLPGNPNAGIAVIAGRKVPVPEIEAVVTRITFLSADDLPTLIPAERPYAAAEMSAFLVAWLGEMTCPVINRPQAGSINGPPWQADDWQLAAGAVGVPVAPRHVRVSLGADLQGFGRVGRVVNVVGDECIGGSGTLRRYAMRLARHAKVDSLCVGFRGGPRKEIFVGADVCVDLSKPAVVRAMWGHLSGRMAAVA
jgi:hypothetical protein